MYIFKVPNLEKVTDPPYTQLSRKQGSYFIVYPPRVERVDFPQCRDISVFGRMKV